MLGSCIGCMSDSEEQHEEEKDHDNAIPCLDLLVRCCDLILQTSLSYRTLSPSFSFVAEQDDDEGRRTILFERGIAKWLDAKILQAERLCCKPAPSSSSSSSSSDKQQQLLHRTSQLQLEHKLVKRFLVSQLQQPLDKNSNNHDSSSLRTLRQEAVSARNRQVAKALELSQQLSDIRTQLDSVRDETRDLNWRNQQLWARVVAPRQESASSSAPKSSTKELENVVLQRVLVDLIVGSGVDWYLDERLREIVVNHSKDI